MAAAASTTWRRRSAPTLTRCCGRSATMRMRLPRCMRGKWCEERRSLNPQVRVPYHLAPPLDLELDARGPLVRRIGDRLETERRQLLPYLGLRDAFRDLARQQIDDLLWRARGGGQGRGGFGLLARGWPPRRGWAR